MISKHNDRFMALLSSKALRSCCWIGIVASIAGCQSEQREATYPFRGQVTQNGKPVAYASVVLHPVKPSSLETPRPRGTTNDQGLFEITTFETADGAPEGEYRVTIEQWIRSNPQLPPTNHLPAKLADSQSSGLKVHVAAENNPPAQLELRR